MKVHRIFCGLQSSQLDEAQAEILVRDLAMKHFANGHTIYEAEGRWKGALTECNERTLILEVWEVAGFGQPAIGRFALDYKDGAFQESVVIISTEAEAVVL